MRVLLARSVVTVNLCKLIFLQHDGTAVSELKCPQCSHDLREVCDALGSRSGPKRKGA